jgi:uncharacterized protein YchJ
MDEVQTWCLNTRNELPLRIRKHLRELLRTLYFREGRPGHRGKADALPLYRLYPRGYRVRGKNDGPGGVGAKQWAEGSKWKGLKIASTKKGEATDTTGMIEFTATYEKDGEGIDHHEISKFRKTKDGKWLFVDGESHTHKEGEGHHESTPPVVRTGPKIGRNDPCHCGSGKKFKKCCEGV